MKIEIKITGQNNAKYYGVNVGTCVWEDFEKYIAAVVASEVGNAPLEACKAQAIASRTFAYRYILKDKPIPDNSLSAQAFRIERYSDSYKTCISATEATAGLFLSYNNTPIDAYFCHSNGGLMVSSQEKWGGARPYLVSKPDQWSTSAMVNKSGHGVGLSQVGAKYAAQHGYTYKDILNYYYPGTTIQKIKEKEECLSMISLERFLNGCKRNASRIKGYKQPYSGQNGLSDCIGYIIGSLELEGQKWGGTHGSNYAKRYRTRNFHVVTNPSQLKLGEIVYKGKKPGDPKYALPAQYTKLSNPDLIDYYHVGVVTSVNPLEISHCSTGGMNYDKKLGNWKYAGECSLVDYGSGSASIVVTPVEKVTTVVAVNKPGKAIVDVPDDTTVNVRSRPSTSGALIVKLNEGTQVDVISVSGDWCKINYEFNKTGVGYVMSQFIRSGVVDVPNDTTVNVRASASTSATKLTTIPEGGKVKVLSKDGAWSKVEYSVAKSGTGYVMSRYLKKG